MRIYTLLALLCLCSSFGYGQKTKKQKAKFNPQVMETQFELLGGLICIQSDETGHGKYVLDTGAPTLIINRKPNFTAANGFRLIGLNSVSPIANTKIKDFDLNGLDLGNVHSYMTDLTSLERLKQDNFQGILGYQVLKKFEMFIDYERQYLSLFQHGANDMHGLIKPVESIPIVQKGHMAVVKVKINNRNYYFGIDTGAEVNVIDARWLNRLKKNGIEQTKSLLVQSLEGSQLRLDAFRVPEMSVGNIDYSNEEFVIADLSYLTSSAGFQLDGILGFPFLSSGKFSINYKKKKLYVWDDPLSQANEIERISALNE